MASFSDFFSRFFRSQNNSVPDIPFLHESIDLKAYPVADMLEWHRDGEWDGFKSEISQAFSNRLITGKLLGPKVSILESSHSNGWLIHCSKLRESKDISYKHLAYYLQTIVKAQGYTINLAEVKSQQRRENLETVVKYYLKPSLKNRFGHKEKSELANQLFGNVTIEYKTISGLPYEFKFLVNAYQDHKFLPPYDFDLLMDAILK